MRQDKSYPIRRASKSRRTGPITPEVTSPNRLESASSGQVKLGSPAPAGGRNRQHDGHCKTSTASKTRRSAGGDEIRATHAQNSIMNFGENWTLRRLLVALAAVVLVVAVVFGAGRMLVEHAKSTEPSQTAKRDPGRFTPTDAEWAALAFEPA